VASGQIPDIADGMGIFLMRQTMRTRFSLLILYLFCQKFILNIFVHTVYGSVTVNSGERMILLGLAGGVGSAVFRMISGFIEMGRKGVTGLTPGERVIFRIMHFSCICQYGGM
jgi:hypothetical protein